MSLDSLARNFAMRDGARGVPAIGPGARTKSPDGAALAEIARSRRGVSRTVAYRKSWCNRPDCPGHADEARC